MESRDLEHTVGAGTPSPASDGAPARETTPLPLSPDAVVGTAQHLRATYVRAAAAADRAVGIWLARTSAPRTPANLPPAYTDRASGEFRALRAVVRASATAYARRLRRDGETPERMVVLVKAAIGNHRIPGFSAQELTNDLIRWSIEAYFDE
jgi:hypothetical protein